MIWIGCQCTNHACWLSDANLLWNKINRAWEKLLVFHIHVTETKHLILLIFFIQQYKSVNTMKHHLYKQQKQCIVQSAWRFQITIEKVKSELSWNRSFPDWFESSSHFAQVQTFVLHAASPTWKIPKCWEWLSVYYASLLPYALQHQMAPFQTWALLVRSSSRTWVAFWSSSQIWKTGKLFKYSRTTGLRWKLWSYERGPLPFKRWYHTEIVGN